MKRMRNRAVAEAWRNDEAATSHTGNFRTDGKHLWSYDLQIGDSARPAKGTYGFKVLKDYTANGTYGFKSQTTSCHVGYARYYADSVV